MIQFSKKNTNTPNLRPLKKISKILRTLKNQNQKKHSFVTCVKQKTTNNGNKNCSSMLYYIEYFYLEGFQQFYYSNESRILQIQSFSD